MTSLPLTEIISVRFFFFFFFFYGGGGEGGRIASSVQNSDRCSYCFVSCVKVIMLLTLEFLFALTSIAVISQLNNVFTNPLQSEKSVE